ncbi:partial 1-deoxy-D-xylulose-5-phosphate synthase, partial [Gammaproteobacteria bacterium]
MLYTGFLHDGPAAVRYPRGCGSGVPTQDSMQALPIGKGELRREGKRVAILAFGSLLTPALQAGETLDATVVNMRFVKPLDVELAIAMARTHELVVTLEENAVMGGAGSAVSEALQAAGLSTAVLQLGLPDRFIEHGNPEQLLSDCGLDQAGIVAAVEKKLSY